MSSAESPFAAFRYRSYVLYQSARFLLSLGWQMQGVAVAWQVYALTNDELALGYVGLAQFLPIFGFSLVTGQVADRFDRRLVLIGCTALLAVASLGLVAFSRAPHAMPLSVLYGLLFLVGTARAFYGPAGAGLQANIVPQEVLRNAITWGSTLWEIVTITGPSLGGVLYAATGKAESVYVLSAVFELLAVGLLLGIDAPKRVIVKRAITVRELLAGIDYLRSHRVLLGAVTLDLFAVLFGGAVALLPVFARDILHEDSRGLGMLRSAPAVGAALMAIFLAYRPLRRHAGKTMLVAVAGFGLATIVFGLSRSFWISIAALSVAGAMDMVSVNVRQSLLQLGVPDDKRGRVTAVTGVFVSASNELGEFESGVMAHLLGAVGATVFGGIGTIAVVLACVFVFPALRDVDELEKVIPPE
jgi:MFS family permease